MFSVLLSVYRKEQPAYLLQCLTSIFNQTLLPDEVVLVKDVSGIKIGVRRHLRDVLPFMIGCWLKAYIEIDKMKLP